MHKDLHTEQEILVRLVNRDETVIAGLYRQHYKVVSKWIVKRGGNEADAADVCQESMIVLYEKSKDEHFRLSCKITTYLFAIAKNLWYKKIQARQGEVQVPDEEQQDHIEGNYTDDIKVHQERELHYEQLDSALNMLGEPCSSILKSYYYKNKSMQQIAGEFGYTNADNAKTQKYKCLNRLKKIFYGIQVK